MQKLYFLLLATISIYTSCYSSHMPSTAPCQNSPQKYSKNYTEIDVYLHHMLTKNKITKEQCECELQTLKPLYEFNLTPIRKKRIASISKHLANIATKKEQNASASESLKQYIAAKKKKTPNIRRDKILTRTNCSRMPSHKY